MVLGFLIFFFFSGNISRWTRRDWYPQAVLQVQSLVLDYLGMRLWASGLAFQSFSSLFCKMK